MEVCFDTADITEKVHEDTVPNLAKTAKLYMENGPVCFIYIRR